VTACLFPHKLETSKICPVKQIARETKKQNVETRMNQMTGECFVEQAPDGVVTHALLLLEGREFPQKLDSS
jgi:hypothetical protein